MHSSQQPRMQPQRPLHYNSPMSYPVLHKGENARLATATLPKLGQSFCQILVANFRMVAEEVSKVGP